MSLFKKLWDDDVAAVLSTEYILMSGILITGVGTGMGYLRDSVNNSYKQIGANLESVVPKDISHLTKPYGNLNVNKNDNNQVQNLTNYNYVIVNPRQP